MDNDILKEQQLIELLNTKDDINLKSTFAFNNEINELIALKFQLWSRKFFPKYFTSNDATFHNDIDLNNIRAYKGEINSFVDIVFRGGAKTARTKLFLAFCICNDLLHRRKYIKVLCEDVTNSKQITTDIYNMLVSPDIKRLYPEIFKKTDAKREETMSSFTTTTGIKMISGTVGTEQRGAIQEDARPDLIWFEDFENRMTLRSAVKTKAIYDNMEEARTGLAKDGSCIYTCNYISERGNVHVLVTKERTGRVLMIIPLVNDAGEIAWDRYSPDDIEQMMKDDDDFEGERLCKPSAGKDIMFDREQLDKMEQRLPLRDIAGFRIFKRYDPSHRIASGHDVAGGVGLDSSTSVFIDFDTIPAQIVATYASNEIKPDIFGDEIARQADQFGEPLVAIEKNNHGHATIGRLKQIYPLRKIYATQPKQTKIILPIDVTPTEYGWDTNALTKPKMLFDLTKAIDNGLIALNDPRLITEAKSYTRNDLMDAEVDPRLTTRHFDLLVACAIAWQMKDHAGVSKEKVEAIRKAQEILDNTDFDQFAVI